jgi:hypothetical protein
MSHEDSPTLVTSVTPVTLVTCFIGCFCQYVNDRHTHSAGPKRKRRIHSGLQISCTIQIATTT